MALEIQGVAYRALQGLSADIILAIISNGSSRMRNQFPSFIIYVDFE